MRQYLYILLAALTLSGCIRQQTPAPQKPHILGKDQASSDPTLDAIRRMNHEMAMAADQEVQDYVRLQPQPFEQQEGGYWFCLSGAPGQGNTIQRQESCQVILRICSLDGTELTQTEGQYAVEQDHLPQAIRHAMTRMRHGESATLVCPYYTAYGATGNARIPAYENVIIYIELL